MKDRKDVARFIENQFSWEHLETLDKNGAHHYGLQELRELMDFVYGGPPSEDEKISGDNGFRK